MAKLTRLRVVRERKAITQAELAQVAGLSRTAVANIEAGRSQPYPSTVRKLATALGVEPAALMEPVQGLDDVR